MAGHVFISYAARDGGMAKQVCEYLERSGFRCWIALRDVAAGSSYVDGISDAIRSSIAALLVLSQESNRSSLVARDVSSLVEKQVPVLPVLVAPVEMSPGLQSLVGKLRCVDISRDRWPDGLHKVVLALASIAPRDEQPDAAVSRESREPTTKGYVFISYSRDDSGFVARLKEILRRRGYAYWDYSESERDYHGALYRELEERIENAKAFMCVVTDSWRETEWPAAECIYAKEAKVPIFVIVAGKLSRPVPILINRQTRIDMVRDFTGSASVLERELDKKGL